MSNNELAQMDIADLAPLIEGREVSPVAVMESQLDRIAALNPGLTAYTSLYPDMALAAAKSAVSPIRMTRHRSGPTQALASI